MPERFDKDEVLAALFEAGRLCAAKVDAYMIGGGAMIFRAEKRATKDVDLVVGSDSEANQLTDAFGKIGFETSLHKPEECRALKDAMILVTTKGMRVR